MVRTETHYRSQVLTPEEPKIQDTRDIHEESCDVLPEFVEMVEHEGTVKAVLSFMDVGMLDSISYADRYRLRDASRTLRAFGVPVGLIGQDEQLASIRTRARGISHNGFILYDHARRLYTPPLSRPHRDEAFADSSDFPTFQKDTSNIFGRPGLMYLNDEIHDVSDWGATGIIPVYITDGRADGEILNQVHQLNGLDLPIHESMLAEIGEFITRFQPAHPQSFS